jgi:Kef-type K+ transport system membrane component KefB
VALYAGLNLALLRRMWRWRRRGLTPKIGLLALGLVLGVGISATTVLYTSFQWINYLLIGGILNIEASRRSEPALPAAGS